MFRNDCKTATITTAWCRSAAPNAKATAKTTSCHSANSFRYGLCSAVSSPKLAIPLQDFARGASDQQPLAVAGEQVAVNICYEDAFGEEIIRQLPQASLLVNVSNVAWFGRSFAPQQHLQIAQMRALETGRYMLRATNTGMTAVIDPHGQVVRSAPEFATAIVTHSVQGYQGATPYIYWGNYAVLALALLLITASFIMHNMSVLNGRRKARASHEQAKSRSQPPAGP